MVSEQPAVQNLGRPLGELTPATAITSVPEGALDAAGADGAVDDAGADEAGAGADGSSAELQAKATTITITTASPVTTFMSNNLGHICLMSLFSCLLARYISSLLLGLPKTFEVCDTRLSRQSSPKAMY